MDRMDSCDQASDLLGALNGRELWMFLAWQDIKLRYRRSKIGPFWITLSMAIFCLSLGVVYSQLFKADIREYMPFLSIGFVFWALISGMLVEFPNVFVENAPYIKDVKVNPFSIIFRVVARHLITLSHNALIVLGIYLYFGINPGLNGLWAIPGLLLVLVNLTAIGVTLSLFGSRFRDVGPITQSLVQVLFFLTPVTWFPRLVAADSWILQANPFAYYLDLLRSPLLGSPPAPAAWAMALATAFISCAIAGWLYRRKAKRIPFWV